jgi:hypothetical protein
VVEMIERIRLDNDQEHYRVEVSQNQIVVIMCLSDGALFVGDRYSQDPLVVLQKYETWTSFYGFDVKAQSPQGAEFLIVRYFR